MASPELNLNLLDAAGLMPDRPTKRLGRHRTLLLWLTALVWLAVIGLCLAMIERYTATPGDGGDAPIRWPAQSFIPLDPGRPTLVLFAHPRCPCTRATIGELALLMASVPGRLNAQVWFLQPENTGADWTNTDLWSSAAAIPGVTVRADSDGREAARFHAATSGQALLYGTDGHLLFTGGITIARGHSGDNPGRSAIADLVMDQPTQTIQTPVFGCSLFNSQCQTRGPAWKP